ncbi:MAG: YqgE/AlgH family protein [Nitrospiraceae bacterium]
MSSLSRRSIGWFPTDRLWLVAGLFIGFLLTVAAKTASATEPEHEVMPPLGKGVFLVASPNLTDPNFRQTVVLICEFGPEGTLGIIVNRPTNVPLSEALPQITALKETSHVLFAGGPVQPNGILMLFRVRQEPAGSRRVFEEVYLGGNMQTLERVLTRPEPTETFRAYAGYAGWAPGQLEFEMALGSWATVQADARSIFEKESANLWPDMLRTLSAPRVIRSRVIPRE